MWLILVDRLPRRVKDLLRQGMTSVDLRGNFLMQVFANDISMALKENREIDVVEVADRLARILHGALKEIGLALSIEKRQNFLIRLGENALRLFKRGDPTSR